MDDSEALLRKIPRRSNAHSRFSRLFASLMILALCFSLLGEAAFLSGPSRTYAQEGPPMPQIPAPPAPMTLPEGSPEVQAAAFADAIDQSEEPVAAWLGLYDALDIPVLGEGVQQSGGIPDDPIGPSYWEVWYTSPGVPGSGLTLTDYGRMLTSATGDDVDLGALLLDDLRAGAASDDPQARLFASFVIERMRRAGTDPLDSAAVPDDLVVDPPTMLLVGWTLLRGLVAYAAQGAETSYTLPEAGFGGFGVVLAHYTSSARRSAPMQASLASTCELGSPGVAATWLSFALSQMRDNPRGFSNAVKTTISRLSPSIPMTDAQMVSAVGKGEQIANVLPPTYLLALQMAGYWLQISSSPATLVRTRQTGNWGETVDLDLTLNYSSKLLPGGDLRSRCVVYFAYKQLGPNVNFPPDGPVPGGELAVNITTNTDRVGISGEPSADRIVRTTDSGGKLQTRVAGRPQTEQIPDSAKPLDMEYNVIVTLRFVELTTLNGQNTVYVGPTMIVSFPLGASSPLLDAVSGFTYRLGKYPFPLQDWKIKTWQARMGTALSITGTVCDFAQPFAVEATDIGGIKWSMVYTPSDDQHGTFVQTMTVAGNGVDIEGTYTLHEEGDDRITLDQAAEQLCVNSPDGRQCVPGVAGMDVAPVWFTYQPDATECEQTQPQ